MRWTYLEQRMREAVDLRFRGATVLRITRRLKSITNADHVVVLRDGKLTYKCATGKLEHLSIDHRA